MTVAGTFDAVIAQARAAAVDGERHRRWAPGLVEAAKRDGLFCMLLPQRFGGLGCEPATVVDVLDRLAHALLDDAVGHAWAAVCEGTPGGVEHQDRMTLALHHAMDVALDCADVAYCFAGTAVVRSGDTIQRCFRDLHTARKHLVYGLNGYRGVARHTLGVT